MGNNLFDDKKKKDKNNNDFKIENQIEQDKGFINKKDEANLELKYELERLRKEMEEKNKKEKEQLKKEMEEKNKKEKDQLKKEMEEKNKKEKDQLKKDLVEEINEKLKIQRELFNFTNQINFKKTTEENILDSKDSTKQKSDKKPDYEIIKENIKNIELISNSTTRSSKIRKIENIRSINKRANEEKDNEDIQKFEKKINYISKEIYKDSLYIIINDLEESFNEFESIKSINDKIKEKKDKIKEIIFKEFYDNYQINTNQLMDIINYLRENQNLLYEKRLYNKIIYLINLIEDLKDEIYMEGEKKNLEKTEVNYIKIGSKGLKEIVKIEKNLQEEIDDFTNRPTILIFNFLRLNQSKKFYEKINILGEEHRIDPGQTDMKIELHDLISYNGFESQTNIELLDKNNINSKKLLIDVILYKENYYELFLDITDEEKEKETYSVEIVYVSNNIELLPKEVKISEKTLTIKESLLNMKRIVLLNLRKIELTNYLCSFPYFDTKKKEIIEINLNSSNEPSTNLFINIIIDKEGIKGAEADITIFPVVHKIPNEFSEEDINIINYCYKNLSEINSNFLLDTKQILILLSKIGKDNEDKLMKILDKFICMPFYIIYKDKKPDKRNIETIEKCCILKLLFHNYKIKDYELISQKVKFFIQKKKEYENIEDNKVKMFAMIDTSKYLLTIEKREEFNNFSFNLKNMEDLPVDSPFIESEIKFREIITKLKDDSKLRFLFLQLNSGAGKDLLTSKTFYQIKMIPLISIKMHLLKDFSSYFYIYSISSFKDLAYNNPQTNLKGYNELCLKKGHEDISLLQSNLNTVKLLFLKLHENCHSKFSGNYNFEISPQIAFKTNLSKLSIDKALSIGIIGKTLNYKYKKYLSKIPSNEDEDKKDSKDENYTDIIYHYLEDVGDEIEEKYNEKNVGESGAAMEYYLSNNLYCTTGIVMYQGDLNRLLNTDLYTGESLLSLKRIIERKIKILYNQNPELIKRIANYKNYSYNYKNIKKGPGEMLTHSDIGLLINV